MSMYLANLGCVNGEAAYETRVIKPCFSTCKFSKKCGSPVTLLALRQGKAVRNAQARASSVECDCIICMLSFFPFPLYETQKEDSETTS